MELVTTIIGTLVIVMFIIMVAVIIKGGKAKVYIFDEHNGIYIKRGTINGDTVAFRYNNTSKGGIAIEGNKYKQGKNKAFFYRDVNGILLPIIDKKVNDKISSLELSTSQEKLYETEALKNVIKKIDNTFWSQIKPLLMGMMIIFGAVIVSIVMIQKALDVEPIPEPQLEMWKDTTKAMQTLVKANQELVKEISINNLKTTKKGEPPK